MTKQELLSRSKHIRDAKSLDELLCIFEEKWYRKFFSVKCLHRKEEGSEEKCKVHQSSKSVYPNKGKSDRKNDRCNIDDKSLFHIFHDK